MSDCSKTLRTEPFTNAKLVIHNVITDIKFDSTYGPLRARLSSKFMPILTRALRYNNNNYNLSGWMPHKRETQLFCNLHIPSAIYNRRAVS